MNFSANYCDSGEKVIDSQGFLSVLRLFINHFKKNHYSAYRYLTKCSKISSLEENVIQLFKLLLVINRESISEINEDFALILLEKEHLIEFLESLYDYWRRLERYSLVYNRYFGEGLQKTTFIEANDHFTNLILSTYRTINEKLRDQNSLVYRQLNAGANAAIVLQKVQWNQSEKYIGLSPVPFIESIVLNPPFIAYPKENTRKGLFKEAKDNPLHGLSLTRDDWFCYPAKVGHSLAYVFFHKDFITQGVTLANLFELAKIDECKNQKPDLIYVFGYKDQESRAVYYHDQEEDIMIGYLSYDEKYDYFGYMKKMILTLHNVRTIKHGQLPIHGAMVNVIMKDDKERNIVIIGDSGAGKSESLEALRTLGEEYIKEMRIIFDDMGTFSLENGQLKAYGTEIGAFIRLDDLDSGYAYRQIDRSIFMNPNKTNARIIIPVSDYTDIVKGYPVDIVLYANNYEDKAELEVFKNLEEAKEVFINGARMAKGTTAETGLVETFFANPFGPVQHERETRNLIDTYFQYLFEHQIIVGQIRTRLGLEGYQFEGPKKAAEKLFKYILEEVF